MKCPKCDHEFEKDEKDSSWTKEDIALAIGRHPAQLEFLNRFNQVPKNSEIIK